MVKLFCTDVQAGLNAHETLISVFSRAQGTSVHINIKDLCIEPGESFERFNKILTEQLTEALNRVNSIMLENEPVTESIAV
jgi:hypothetical protein